MELFEHEEIDFADYITDHLLPQMKRFQIKKASVSNGFGDKATITRDKHGFYKVKFEYVKEQL
ncbi:hypothetical protein [Peribacillus frigoritolerans]|uniref:Uncharacterized protein n=1 Tax=Peribacillus castrilensis TaxID=2897690 RepID=A0AAW9NGT4_9BACI|nr:hypothetical protein [Peribacillus castrilensis]